MPVHKGSCHCRAVTFEFEAPAEGMVAWDCNCKQALISTPGHQTKAAANSFSTPQLITCIFCSVYKLSCC
jgi:hypothetical protein